MKIRLEFLQKTTSQQLQHCVAFFKSNNCLTSNNQIIISQNIQAQCTVHFQIREPLHDNPFCMFNTLRNIISIHLSQKYNKRGNNLFGSPLKISPMSELSMSNPRRTIK